MTGITNPSGGGMIEPALTAEEWANTSATRGRDGWEVAIEAGDGISFRYDADKAGSDDIGVPVSALPAVVALANAALPDDDPRKLVAADVKALNESAELIEGEYHHSLLPSALCALAARIAALLPPEAK
jgi:hypothetical protein